MATPQTAERVIIVGAGLAGLSLAQGLKKAEPRISFHVFERDTNASFRAQGYRLRIPPDGAHALQQLLPAHLWAAFEKTCAHLPSGEERLDALTGEAVVWARPKPPPNLGSHLAGKSYNADRAVLRDVLMNGLGDHISFGKRFDDYTVTSSGEIQVRFDDGSTELGTVVVGADGARSAVRRLLLPDLNVLDTEGRAVFGKTHLTPKVMDQVSKAVGKGHVLAAESQESLVKLFSDVMEFDRAANEEREGPVFELPVDYIYWVLCFRRDVLASAAAEDKLPALTNVQSAQTSFELTSKWHAGIRAIFENQDQSSASMLMFLTCTSENLCSAWADRRSVAQVPIAVTLLGDAAHPMPPIGGVGATAAFQDANDLCQALTDKAQPLMGDVDRIAGYEQKMVQRVKAAVQRSGIGAGHFFGMKPIGELKPAAL